MAVEKELIKGINLMMQGNEAGFNILYSYTYNYVYGRAKMIMKDEEDALDLTQETFIQAYRGIHTLEDVNNIYAWLGGIVYRNGMKIFRKKRDLLVNEDGESIFENVVSEDKDFRPEITAEEKATSNIIMGMIDELPELQRAAILAFYYDNMKIDDIAEVFDCSSNTIKSRLNYAKKFLKERVEMHEKKYAYKLHSLSPAVIFLALRSLLAGETYTMSAVAAQSIYNLACSTIGFVPTAIVAGEAGATFTVSAFAESYAASAGAATTAGASATTTTAAGASTATTAGTTTTAGATTVAGTTATAGATTSAAAGATATGAAATAGATAATGVAASTGMALGTKVVIGLAAIATAGTVTVGGATIVNNGGFDNLFGQETVIDVDDEDDDDEDREDETETMTEETETETEEVVYESYSQIVEVMSDPEYMVVDDIQGFGQKASLMGDAIVRYAGGTAHYDFKDIEDSGKYTLNYHIMYMACSGDSAYQIPQVPSEEFEVRFKVEDVEEYLANYYEGGTLVEHPYNGYEIDGDEVVFRMADGEEQPFIQGYTLYMMDEYVMIDADVSMYNWETDQVEPQFETKILFRISDESPYGLQVVHVQTTE